MLISGVVNVLANWNDVNSFADGFLYFSIGMSSGFFGAAAGGAMASSIVTGGFIGGAASGAVGGFAGGFIGGAGNAFMYGQNPLKAGLVGGTIGAPIGAITGGLIRGIYDNIHGYDFWNGSKTTNFELGGLNDIDVETAARFGKQYDASPSAEVDTDVLKDKMQKVFGVREGHYKAVITSKTGGFGMSSYGSYVDLETNEIVGGYVRSFSSGYQELHISPRFINGDIVGFKAIAGHELGHVIHNYSIPHTYGYKLFHQYSERACYQYTYNVYSNAGRWQDALNTYINAYSRNYWGYYPSIYKLPF
jgi:hypothetical protein